MRARRSLLTTLTRAGGTRARAVALAAACVGFAASASPTSAWAQGAAEPSAAEVAQATNAFKTGSNLFKLNQWEKALEQFQKSYDTVNSPNSLLYVARCKVKLERYEDAYQTFLRVVDEGKQREVTEPKYKPTRETAEVELQELVDKHLAVVTVVVDGPTDGAKLTIGGKEIPHEAWAQPIPLMPGESTVVFESPGRPAQSETLVLAAGDRKDMSFDTNPPPAPEEPVAPPPPPEEEDDGGGMSPFVPAAIAAGGVALVGLTLFAVAGSMSNSTFDKLEAECAGPCPDESNRSLIDQGKTEQTIANVGLIVGAVGLAASATFVVLAITGGEPEVQTGTRLELGPTYVGVRGTY